MQSKERIKAYSVHKKYGYVPLKALELMQEPDSIRISQAEYYEAEEELSRLEAQGITFLTWTDPFYPKLLLQSADPPVGLFVRGSALPGTSNMTDGQIPIAIVGTRDLTNYGKEWTWRIVEAMSKCRKRPIIVSGLALGIDECAHEAALQFGLSTIGVLPTCPDSIYPPQHEELADRISSTPGCFLISDYPPGTAPSSGNFLRRNRIIAGMSVATLLSESKIRGGGMMTARLAFSYDRDVYALPGRIDSIRSQGCNLLISQKKAEIITDAATLCSNLGLVPPSDMKAGTKDSREMVLRRASLFYSSDPRKADLLELLGILSETSSSDVGHLSSQSGLDYLDTVILAGKLECDGFILMDIFKQCSIRNDKKISW